MLEGFRTWTFVINDKAGTADLSGEGNSILTFTSLQDVGRFVVAALELDRWEDGMGMVSSTMLYNSTMKCLTQLRKSHHAKGDIGQGKFQGNVKGVDQG